MKKINTLHFNNKLLQLFIFLMETRSVTLAAESLKTTQSSVSHMLKKLRIMFDDPLFISSGRQLIPTMRAEALLPLVEQSLNELSNLFTPEIFEPALMKRTIVIAANDLQRDLLLPQVFNIIRDIAPNITLRIVPSNTPKVNDFREGTYDMAITPRVPESSEILQKRLFSDEYHIFYDAKVRNPIKSKDEYLQAEHISIHYPSNRHMDIDLWLEEQRLHRRVAIWVEGFSGITPFILGSNRIATMPSRLINGQLHQLSQQIVPFICPEIPIFLIWHKRYQHEAWHRWVRKIIESVAQKIDFPVCVENK